MQGFPGGASGKEPARQCKRPKSCGLIPGPEDPQRRAWQLAPVFLPGESHGQRSLVGYSPWGHKEAGTTEHTAQTPLSCISAPRPPPSRGSSRLRKTKIM